MIKHLFTGYSTLSHLMSLSTLTTYTNFFVVYRNSGLHSATKLAIVRIVIKYVYPVNLKLFFPN